MQTKNGFLLCFLSVISISGCSNTIDRTMSPPSDTKWVNVEIKNPSPYTQPFVGVRYISKECLRQRISGADGSVVTEPSYNNPPVSLVKGNDDIWRAKVEMAGGGKCKWTLSALKLGIKYIDATHLGKDLVPGTSVGAEIAFDDDASRNGQYKDFLGGDVALSPRYYPYITEWKLLETSKDLSLFGKVDYILLRVYDSKNIILTPSIDESKVIKYIEPEKKIDGVSPKIIYPDGTVAPEKTLFPDFDKVDKMIMK
ncbi:hypothetical protein [Enterobacter asburiae]|uniref:hypothetical protein n=1 Tax=Enterobacter asburiae TaxID=61645 RepID=UPI001CBD36E4|nr:hypothetical protein [Enterobacter asburiae]UAN16694.1 hypothetical protein KGP20_02800 [Enterobacter asburiae]